ncbi:chloroplast sensor kinase, chloroplastic [Prunus avium]|uniref:Chloroplast sensor kinase, chloroplastic n=1 Tax=Prunus avium TaxID=42229 RepID=A0A6P5U350_PRUAV|nr:chloroplast sensor kinase, chloroplastic [Prunus avium]
MLLLSATTHQHPSISTSTVLFPSICHKLPASLKPNATSAHRPHDLLITNAFSPSSLQNPNPSTPQTIRHVTHSASDGEPEANSMVPSASAVASAIRRASTSPVDFIQRIEKEQKRGIVLPSPDFQRLCIQQLDIFRRIVDPDALLSVYVRPAGSYVMDRLELRRVTCHPGAKSSDIVILVGSFSVATGFRAAEAVLSNHKVEVIAECKAAVFPMVKHPFVVGFLVAEFPRMEMPPHGGNVQCEGCDLVHRLTPEEAYALPPSSNIKSWDTQNLEDQPEPLLTMYNFSAEQRSNAINISRSLAMAYVMDQKAMLLQQSSWQNNVRMSSLVEQIRGPLSSLRTLSKMLSMHMKRSEISYDIVEDILVQGDRMKDTLQQLQDAVYLTKASIMRYGEHDSTYSYPDSGKPQVLNNLPKDSSSIKMQVSGEQLSLNAGAKDMEMPMPPLALAPLQQHGIRPCNVSDILADLVEAVRPLAQHQQRVVELNELGTSLQVAVEEPALRQALSNLIESALLRTHNGGKVEIVSTGAPAGGVLVVIDDDGPDMHYMTQMHSLTPFGADLLSENMVEDNMTWNFVAGVTVAREILESYGCVVRVISPRTTDAPLGAGGTRVELWLPSIMELSRINDPAPEA